MAAQQIAEAIRDQRKQLAPARHEEAQQWFNLGMVLMDTRPADAVLVFSHLLTNFPDSPLAYRSYGCVYRAQALHNLGQREAALEQCDLCIESLKRAFPRGSLADEPEMRLVDASIAMALNLREEIAPRQTS
jgi:tetratricopeptide (TPR) repeat protein